LRLASDKPLYVIEVKPEENAVVVGPRREVEAGGLIAEHCNYILGYPPPPGETVQTQIRYHAPAVASHLWADDKQARVKFVTPQHAVAPGQAAVFYRGDEVVGGGIIACKWDDSAKQGE